MKIILFGAPGSGKGTQADMLAKEFDLEKISLGDILRQEVKKESDLGREVKQYMDKGELVPDSTVKDVIDANLAEDNFILDGYPRNGQQAQTLNDILKKRDSSIDAFIYLDVSQETIVDRLSKRRVCKKCGANYHLNTMPPKEDNICDQCSAELVQRDDDTPEVIKKRWNVFLANSKEVFDFYKKKNVFISVDGDQDKEKVFEQVKEKLEAREQ
ncbi:MAG: adenylate kinase [Candidatus Omnitrophica bacterium]|nr:adenylate kinase [Candidatus Omnitrophota bacterium]MCF7893512.1 adenylate kinase [Candidatus Omnitrophota bacterium]